MISVIKRSATGHCVLCHSGSIDTVDPRELRAFVVAEGCGSWENRYAIAGRTQTTLGCDGMVRLIPSGDSSSPARIAETPVTVAPIAANLPGTSAVKTAVAIAPTARIVEEEEIVRPNEIMMEAGESFVHGRILSGIGGLIAGGPIGGITGFLTGGGGRPAAPAAPVRTPVSSFGQVDPCPGGFKIPGTNQCFEGPIQPQPTTGTDVVIIPEVAPGIFGALSAAATMVASSRMVCPRGLVLGMDNRCYAKGTLPKKFRKWRPATKPPVTAADAKAIRLAAAAKGRVKTLAKSVGLHTHSAHRRTTKKSR